MTSRRDDRARPRSVRVHDVDLPAVDVRDLGPVRRPGDRRGRVWHCGQVSGLPCRNITDEDAMGEVPTRQDAVKDVHEAGPVWRPIPVPDLACAEVPEARSDPEALARPWIDRSRPGAQRHGDRAVAWRLHRGPGAARSRARGRDARPVSGASRQSKTQDERDWENDHPKDTSRLADLSPLFHLPWTHERRLVLTRNRRRRNSDEFGGRFLASAGTRAIPRWARAPT